MANLTLDFAPQIGIDISYSMMGKPEQIAKAMALYLSKQCIQQRRECYLHNFFHRN